MGCDIHLMVEKRVKGKWVLAPWDGTTEPCLCTWKWKGKERVRTRPSRNCYWCGAPKEEFYDLGDDEPRRPTTKLGERFLDWYDGRNYDLFAILANVRNGRGFAGCYTGDGFIPISEPRGVPEDASKEYRSRVAHWGEDGHSHSWLTLAEFLAFDWEQTTCKRGVVSPGQFVVFREKGAPDEWSGGVSGPSVKHVSNAAMVKLISSGVIPDDDLRADCSFPKSDYYTSVSWVWTYRRCCEHFWNEALPRIKRVGDPEKVRLVFFFDC